MTPGNSDLWRISRGLGTLRHDRRVLGLLLILAAAMWGWNWLQSHPGSNPWAPLDLRDAPGWATASKIAELRNNPDQCRAVLERSDVRYTRLAATGEGPCRREDRTQLPDVPLDPSSPPTTCAVAAALEIWLEQGIQPIAQQLYGQSVVSIEHYGSFSCRRIYGGDSGPWSEHATANAIDISAFVLEDGRKVSLIADWDHTGIDADFLRRTRDSACDVFGTVLSPDYNEAHRDHLHLDQEDRGLGGVCR